MLFRRGKISPGVQWSLDGEGCLCRRFVALPDKQPYLVATGLKAVLFPEEEIGVARLRQAPQIGHILDNVAILDNLPPPDHAALHPAEVHKVVNALEARLKSVVRG